MSEGIADRPWPGLASFTEAQQGQFFGRGAETTELLRRVQRRPLTLLFGQSGLGKTSILQAGLLPRLREQGFAPVLLRLDYGAQAPAAEAQILAALGWGNEEGLWERLHRRDREGPTPVLVLDQFEELFTLGQGTTVAAQLVTLLADLIENRPPAALEARLEREDGLFERYHLARCDYRVLIGLREDYLAHLETLKAQMPSITQNRMRLEPLNGAQAMAAVLGPGAGLVDAAAAEAIVRFVAGGAELDQAEVEPALLSLILRELNEQRIANGATQISAEQLAGSHQAILADFYERSLADQPAAVREFIEDQLLTDSGHRESVAEERVLQIFGGATALNELVGRRLLRIEERLQQRRVELTHDVLCAVVQASREGRMERLALAAAEAQTLTERQRTEEARSAVRKARLLAAGTSLLALLALGGGWLAYHAAERARAAELQVAELRVQADLARSEAERLLIYLIDEFFDRLQPIGQVDLLDQFSQRVLDYYRKLPEALRTPESERNHVLAEWARSRLLIDMGQPKEVEALLAAAQMRLTRLRLPEGERSWIRGRLLTMKGLALADQLRQAQASPLLQKAEGELRRALQLGVSGARKDLAYLLYTRGWVQLPTPDRPDALRALRESLDLWTELAGKDWAETGAATRHAQAMGVLLRGLFLDGEHEQVQRLGRQNLVQVRSVLARQPQNQIAMRAAYQIARHIGLSAASIGRLKQALQWHAQAVQFAELALQANPGNLTNTHSAATAHQQLANTAGELGLVPQAEAAQTRATELLDPLASRGPQYLSTLAAVLNGAMNIAFNRGHEDVLRRLLARQEALIEEAGRLRMDGPAIDGLRCRALRARMDIEMLGGRPAKVLALAEASRPSASSCEFWLGMRAAEAAWLMGDYQGADNWLRRTAQRTPASYFSGPFGRAPAMRLACWQAIAAWRQGRTAQARDLLEPVLSFHAEPAQLHDEGAWLRVDRAQAFIARGWIEDRLQHREAALALLRSLPPEMRAFHIVKTWQRRALHGFEAP